MLGSVVVFMFTVAFISLHLDFYITVQQQNNLTYLHSFAMDFQFHLVYCN